jgi:7-cyano-7-deazaguanine synthase in queuosine biosynthesis
LAGASRSTLAARHRQLGGHSFAKCFDLWRYRPKMRAEVRDGPGGAADLTLIRGRNLVSGVDELSQQLGQALTSLEDDLLTLASAIYAADLAFVRPPLENACRSIDLVVPVTNHAMFEATRMRIEYALNVLSRDAWELTFTRRAGDLEPFRVWPEAAGTTLLFSGGLDSLAASVDLLATGVPLTLVSHYTRNPTTIRSQADLRRYLEGEFGPTPSVRVRATGQSSPDATFPPAQQREPSQRTRSFVFVALAAIVARRSGRREIVMMAENGPIAIHLALSTARIGPFSTHTAHPEYLRIVGDLMSALLSVDLRVTNPFLYRTKGELVAPLVGRHDTAISQAVSCWQASRVATGHCGFCIPCLVRRIALEANGYAGDAYGRDLLREDLDAADPDDDGLRNLADLLEFSSDWAGGRTADELLDTYLELRNGDVDAPQAIELYRRFGNEVLRVVRGYPTVVRRLLS